MLNETISKVFRLSWASEGYKATKRFFQEMAFAINRQLISENLDLFVQDEYVCEGETEKITIAIKSRRGAKEELDWIILVASVPYDFSLHRHNDRYSRMELQMSGDAATIPIPYFDVLQGYVLKNIQSEHFERRVSALKLYYTKKETRRQVNTPEATESTEQPERVEEVEERDNLFL